MIFLHAYTHRGPWFVISPKDRIWVGKNLGVGAILECHFLASVLLHCVYSAVHIWKGAYCKTASVPKMHGHFCHDNLTEIIFIYICYNIIKPGLFSTVCIKESPITPVIKIVKLTYFFRFCLRFAHILKMTISNKKVGLKFTNFQSSLPSSGGYFLQLNVGKNSVQTILKIPGDNKLE